MRVQSGRSKSRHTSGKIRMVHEGVRRVSIFNLAFGPQLMTKRSDAASDVETTQIATCSLLAFSSGGYERASKETDRAASGRPCNPSRTWACRRRLNRLRRNRLSPLAEAPETGLPVHPVFASKIWERSGRAFAVEKLKHIHVR